MIQKYKNFYHLIQAILANVLYGFPSRRLKVIAITGTDGKTTTSSLVYHILKQAKFRVALISTVAAYIGDKEIDTGFHVTTPSSFQLQKLLNRVVGQGMEYVVIEVTSHGLDQNRVWGITPALAGVTNVTHEHLDYHKSFEHYAYTKSKLLTHAKRAYINADAKESYSSLKEILESVQPNLISYAFDQTPKRIRTAIFQRFGDQEYNYQNSALASAIAKDCKVKEKIIAKAIENFPGVKGRMQEVPNKLGLKILVDFAHTPNALEHILVSLVKDKGQRPKVKNGNLIVIFGCAGLRDHTKRPLMGEIATRLADYVILTAEDPRTEDIWSIISQIKSGVKTGHQKVISIPDRKEAIRFALRNLAKSGDTVLIAGKGHESSMAFGTIEVPWSDPETVALVLSG